MIVHAIAFSGKTTLTSKKPEIFVDGDDILSEFGQPSRALFKRMMSLPAGRAAIAGRVEAISQSGYTVLCPYDPEALGLKADARYAYSPEEIVLRIRDVIGPDKLLGRVTVEDLVHWIHDFTKHQDTIWMRASEHLEDYLLPSKVMK